MQKYVKLIVTANEKKKNNLRSGKKRRFLKILNRVRQVSRKLYRVGKTSKFSFMNTVEERFKNMHLLDREERIKLNRDLEILRPEFLKPFFPKWWWWRRCQVNVLIVCDGGLNFDTGGFGLSEFLTTFNQLEATTWVDYRVTLAHRGVILNSPNPVVVNHLPNNFNFTSVNLNDFDQIWLFGINSGGGITTSEKNAIATYMNGGGGLFATGDHGSLGNAMCGDIIRVKDMRHWNDTPNSLNDTNEVSMTGRRRNDTNAPHPGNASATTFDHQSDNVPQRIGVKKFGAGFLPHPLLSISTSIRPSGIIDIMPDHPHEGECARETTFTVNSVAIPTQIISTSFVPGGNTSGGKDSTDPHCFPSISVWDGRAANVGRIVSDSTWHHFVNINLNGSGSAQGGLSTSDFNVVRQYYMNIATWMTRRRFFLCWYRYIIFDLFVNSQLIEASLNNPTQNIKEISLADLNSIGALAEEILASKYNPAFARSFLLDLMEDYNKDLAEVLDIWRPSIEKKGTKNENDYYQNWLNLDLILWTSIGAGFIALRDDKEIVSEEMDEKDLERVVDVFAKGVNFGFISSIQNLSSNFNSFAKKIGIRGK